MITPPNVRRGGRAYLEMLINVGLLDLYQLVTPTNQILIFSRYNVQDTFFLLDLLELSYMYVQLTAT